MPITSDAAPLFRMVDDDGGEVVVYPDGVLFLSAGDRPGEGVKLQRRSIVSVMDHAFRQEWQPDILVVVYRDPDDNGRLTHFRWSLVRKGVSREVSNAIYRIVDGGFRKSFTGFFYSLSHRIL